MGRQFQVSHRVVGPDDAVCVIDQADRGDELHEHAAHLFRGPARVPSANTFMSIEGRPFDDAQERGPLGLAAIESITRKFRNPVERAVTIHVSYRDPACAPAPVGSVLDLASR